MGVFTPISRVVSNAGRHLTTSSPPYPLRPRWRYCFGCIQGQHFLSPVSPDLPHACIGLSSAVQGLVRLHDSEEGDLGGTRDRSVQRKTVYL